VEAACSGMRSLIAVFLLATIYGFFVFRSPWKRLLLMALALPFSVLGNLARMLLIIMAAELGGQSWGNYVHEGGPLGIISLVPICRRSSACCSWAAAGKPGIEKKPRMTKQKWILFFVALGLIAGAAGALMRIKSFQKLGQPASRPRRFRAH